MKQTGETPIFLFGDDSTEKRKPHPCALARLKKDEQESVRNALKELGKMLSELNYRRLY